MNAKITRRSIVGYAVNTSPTQDNPGYHFELPTKPMWTGTPKTIGEQLNNDRMLNSLKDTYYSSAWFVKVNGTWMRITDWKYENLDTLYVRLEDSYPGYHGYAYNEIEVDVDYPTETSRAAAAMGRKPKGEVSRENGRRHIKG